MFSTEAARAGEVYDETFHAHARAILEPLRAKLIASGRTATDVDDHSHYGVAFTVNDPSSGGPVYVLLQGDWLLTLHRELTIIERFRGHKREEVDETLVSAIDEALGDLGASPRYWCTRQEYDLMGTCEGPAFRASGARKPKSISLHVYSSDPPVQRGLITSSCVDARLPGDRQWEVAFWQDNGAQEIDGNVTTERVFGWRPQSPDATRVQAAIEANDQTALDELYSRNSVASVDLSVMTNADDAWSATMGPLIANAPTKLRHEDLSDYVSKTDAWRSFCDYASKVETRYSLATSATRNDLSLTFQCDLWRVIGVLANGWMQEEDSRLFSVRAKE